MEQLRGLSSSPEHAYDELVTGQKSIRYHWQGILSIIRALPGGGLSERVESARRQLEESGATVNLLDDRGSPRWTFDPLPVVLTPDEWANIESGVIQRARLLNAILSDFYGPQKLLRERLVPPGKRGRGRCRHRIRTAQSAMHPCGSERCHPPGRGGRGRSNNPEGNV